MDRQRKNKHREQSPNLELELSVNMGSQGILRSRKKRTTVKDMMILQEDLLMNQS